MYKKFLLIFPVLLLVTFGYAYFAGAQQETIEETSNKILSLIEDSNFIAAQTAIGQMKANFALSSELPAKLYQIAYKYEKAEVLEQGKAIYTQIAADFGEQKWAQYANLQLTKLGIYEMIRQGDYKSADEAVGKMTADFAGCPELTECIWEAAKRYDKFKAFDYSKKLCERFIADFPKDDNASLAALLLERLKIYELINSGKYEDANTAVNKIIKDFAGNRHLSRRLYEIAQLYAKKDAKAYAGRLHERIAAMYPEDKYGLRSAVQYKKFEFYGQLDANDFKAAQQTVSQMKNDFADNDEMCKQLDSVGEKYERLGDIEQAKKVWQELLEKSPANSKTAIITTARLEKYALFSAIEDGNKAEVEALVKGLGNRLANSNGFDEYLETIAAGCYSRGRQGQIRNDANHITDYFKAAVAFWERVFVECPNSPWAPAACFSAAAQSGQELGDYAKAVEYFQKVVDEWPGCEYADWAQAKVGIYLEKMVGAGQISKDEAKPLIVKAYQAVIDNYPDSRWAAAARRGIERYK